MPVTTTTEAPPGSRKAQRAVKSPLTHNPAALRQARHAKGLSQRQLAQLVGCTASHVSDLEQATRDAHPRLLARIATALDCPTENLKRVRATRRCALACGYVFDPPWDGTTPMHLVGESWCPGGRQPCVTVP